MKTTKTNKLIRVATFLGASLFLLSTAGATGPGSGIVDSIVNAPIVPGGNVAGGLTDVVINLDVDMDPTVSGLSLQAGDSITITLPDAFVNTGLPIQTPFSPGCAPPFPGCSTAILLQGWPQHPLGVPPPSIPGKWSVTQGATPNEIVITTLVDFAPNPPSEPGLKQIHLFLNGFINPDADHYQIDVQMSTGQSGSAPVKIVPKARPSINVVSVFAMGAPNTIFQQTSLGGSVLLYNFLLWQKGGEPGVGITISNGLLMLGNRTVGHVSIEAPACAVGQEIISLEPSTSLVFPLSAVSTGRLKAQFTTGNLPGIYRVHFRMNGGNEQTMQVTVSP